MADTKKQIPEQGARPVSRAALVAAALAAASGVAVGTAGAQTRQRQPAPAPSDQLAPAPDAEGSAAEGSAPSTEERPVTVFYGVIYNDDIRGGGPRK